ncbi:MAG: ABC transporter ATP-binding protein [Rhizomicrobium sp.]
MSDIVLKAEGLTRELSGEIPVTLVRDVNLEIRRGEFAAIIGPSGSGKSSLLYLLGILDKPTAGRLWVEDTEVSSLSDDQLADLRLSHLGFVFQSNFLLPEFSARENVEIPIQRLGRSLDDEPRARALSLLKDLGLEAQAEKLPHQMSGGQSQRVAIARSLANNPAIILADEPTGNLDTVSSAIVRDILKDLAREKGRTVVVVTHDLDFAAECDRRIHIVDGRISPGTRSGWGRTTS